jgi:acetylornithine deacetylase
MSVEQAKQAVEARLSETANSDPRLREVRYQVSYAGLQAEPLLVDTGHPMIGVLGAAHQKVFGSPPKLMASSATTDARFFNLYGNIPATCYGPEASDIHGIDEWVSLESTLQVTQVLALFIARWCGLERR